ncbi:MAG: exo-alpha-sialidase [Verrucomicrobiae bacterium]|nr:exo-alpha-sialidase [Verrucomicrobiae bacterium]
MRLAVLCLPFLQGIPAHASPAAIVHEFDGSRLPSEQTIPWSDRATQATSVSVQDGALHIIDNGTRSGQLRFLSYPWSADPNGEARVEAEVRVLRCSGDAGVVVLAANGDREAALTLFPDRVSLHRLGVAAPVRLDDAFHHVAMALRGSNLVVSVDGKTILDLAGTWNWPAHEGRNLVGFGSISSAATGEALWRSVRAVASYPDVRPHPGLEHHIVYRQPGVYACFPSLGRTPEGWLATRFGTRSLRSHIDPTGGSATRISKDGGRTWEDAPPGFSIAASDTLRADGNHALAGAVGWRHVPESQKADLEARGLDVRASMKGHVAYASGARSCVRGPDATAEVRPWTPIETPPHRMMMAYNQAAYMNLGAGVRLVAIYGETPDHRRDAYVLRSTDDGDSWRCHTIAHGEPDLGFGETALGTNAAGHVIALMRTAETPRDRGFLYQSISADQGISWSPPTNTGIWGYPAHILTLPDGRLVATYGYRRAPMGIRATLSHDGGQSWDTHATVVLRADARGNGSDLGYPLTALVDDGALLTMYYFNDASNVTHIAATRWQPPGKP